MTLTMGAARDADAASRRDCGSSDDNHESCTNSNERHGDINISVNIHSKRHKKSVRWDHIQTREYALVVGDHPLCQDGLPVSLDWKYSDVVTRKSIVSADADDEHDSVTEQRRNEPQHGTPEGGTDDAPLRHSPESPLSQPPSSQADAHNADPSVASQIASAEGTDDASPSMATRKANIVAAAFAVATAPEKVIDGHSSGDSDSTANNSRNDSAASNQTHGRPSFVRYRRSSYVFPRRLTYQERRERLLHVCGYSEEQIKNDEIALMARKLREHWNVNVCPMDMTEPTPIDYTTLDCELLTPNDVMGCSDEGDAGTDSDRDGTHSNMQPIDFQPADASGAENCFNDNSIAMNGNGNSLISLLPSNLSVMNFRWNDDFDSANCLEDDVLANEDMMILDDTMATAMDLDLTDFEWGDATSTVNE